MNLAQIAKRFIFSSKNFSYTNISLFLSITTFAFSVAISLIVMGVSRSYKNDIESRLQSVEPDLKIVSKNSKFLDSTMEDQILLKLDSLLENNQNIEYSTFREDYLMIKSSGLSNGFLSLSLDKHPSLFYNFIEMENNLDSYFYVSSNFYENNNLDLKQSLTLFNIQEMIENESIKANTLLVSGTFTSNLPIFDKNVIFISPKFHSTLYANSEQSTGVVINGIDDSEINVLKNEFSYKSLDFITWKDNHQNTLYWLTIFTNPIYLIIIFMVLLSIIYQLFANWLLIYDKSNSLYKLKIIGTSNNKIKTINIYIATTILLISLILGYLIAISLSILQNNFSLISVDPSIYIVSELSSDILLSDMIFISIISFISVIASTLLLHNKKKVLYSKNR
tara:strand:+ start:464 stop:1642 length:1179 start_codon:yes stop_codon:yes gene_type:complete